MDEYLDTLIADNRIGGHDIYHVLGRGASVFTGTFLKMSKEEFDVLVSIINITGSNTVFIVGSTYDVRIDVKGRYQVTLMSGVVRHKDSDYTTAKTLDIEQMWDYVKGIISYVERSS